MVVEGSRRARSLTGFFSEAIEPSRNGTGIATELNERVEDSLSKLGLHKLTNGHANGNTNILTERSYLAIVTLAELLKNGSADKPSLVAFLTHMVLVGELDLSGRHIKLISHAKHADVHKFLAAFSQQACQILKIAGWSQAMASNSIECDVIDAVDGRLFLAVFVSLNTISRSVMSDQRLASQFSVLVQALGRVAGTQVDISEKSLPSDDGNPPTKKSSAQLSSSTPAILPFSSPIFDKHLTSINISVAGNRAPRPESARIFQEVTHWHNAKRRLDAKVTKELTGREKGKALRRNQFFMAEMFSYAASLTNAAGKSLEPETVTVGEPKRATPKMLEANKENDPKAKGGKNPQSKAGSDRKNVGKKAMLGNIAANKAAKEEDVTEKTFKAWETARKLFDSETLPSSRFMKAKNYLNDLPDAKHKVVEGEVEFYKICVLLGIYKDLSKAQEDKKQHHSEHLYGVASMLFDSIRRLSSADGLTKIIVELAKEIASSLGLPPVAFPKVDSTRQLSFGSTISLANLPKLPLASSPKDFQLLYCGPYMDRNLDSAPDPRVPFEPDGWQRKVLDELDADKSIFVVAPTSAGKTFISFYAMERILRADDESVLVYVAPTKALVNQIAAEIQVKN